MIGALLCTEPTIRDAPSDFRESFTIVGKFVHNYPSRILMVFKASALQRMFEAIV